MKRVVNITIHGNKFNLKTDASDEYVRNLEDFVNTKIKEIESKAPFQSTEKIALLAVFFIADEFFTYKKEQDEKLDKIEKRMKDLLDK